jgi:peptide/nickel transport system permease protein
MRTSLDPANVDSEHSWLRATASSNFAHELGWAIVKLVGTLIAVSLVVFLATVAVPGDPARAVLGKYATASELRAFDVQYGLNRPVVEQYWLWISHFVRGDFGTSYGGGTVLSLIEPRLPRSLFLGAYGFVIAGVVGVPVGLFAARRSGRRDDIVLTGLTVTVGALPEFVIGILLIMVLGVWIPLFPASSTQVGLVLDPFAVLRAYTLPAFAVSLTIIPYIVRLTRANGREVMRQPYIRAATLRGLSPTRIMGYHVLPNAAPPVVNVLALQLASTIGGVVITETVFGVPGIGQLLIESVSDRDLPVVQTLALMIGGAYVVANLLADLAVKLMTPKLRVAAR